MGSGFITRASLAFMDTKPNARYSTTSASSARHSFVIAIVRQRDTKEHVGSGIGHCIFETLVGFSMIEHEDEPFAGNNSLT